jgi:sigma-B regulation protein RsbU (phosphoserine phosphatase)
LNLVGFPLGIFDDVTYEEWSAILDPGDILVFHSDGLSEAADPHGNQFGVPRLSRSIETHAGLSAGELADRLLGEVQEYTQGAPPQDDRTLLVMKVR